MLLMNVWARRTTVPTLHPYQCACAVRHAACSPAADGVLVKLTHCCCHVAECAEHGVEGSCGGAHGRAAGRKQPQQGSMHRQQALWVACFAPRVQPTRLVVVTLPCHSVSAPLHCCSRCCFSKQKLQSEPKPQQAWLLDEFGGLLTIWADGSHLKVWPHSITHSLTLNEAQLCTHLLDHSS